MVPVVEPPQRRPDRRESIQSTLMEFPSWARGDDSDDEAVHDEAKRRLDHFRGRTARKRRDALAAAGREGGNGHVSSSFPQHHSQLAKRGPPKDAWGPLVDRSAGAVKRRAAKSEDKRGDSEASPESGEEKKPKAPKRLAASLPPNPGNQSIPSLAPLPQSPPQWEPPKVSKERKAPAASDSPPASPTGKDRPKALLPVNVENDLNEKPYSTTSGSLTPGGQGPTSTTVVASPVVTNPTPTLSAGPRKGIDASATETAVVTVTKPGPAESASSSGSTLAEPSESDKVEYNPLANGSLHANTEKALVVVGSIGAIIIAFFAFWLAWKCVRLHKKKDGQTHRWQTHRWQTHRWQTHRWQTHRWQTHRWPSLPSSLSLEKPKQLAMGLASRVPVLKQRFAKRSWTNLDKPYDDAFWEKRLPASDDGPETSAGGIRVHTDITRRSFYGQEDEVGAPEAAALRRTVLSMSEMSSLSSGFGDGDIIMPPADSTTATTTVAMPAPVAQRASVVSHRRDTMYTEASEDPLPRFRSVNSWVRQQSGRIKRAKQRETASDAPPVPSMPPEQDFRLMMPDGEEPRRVETTGNVGYSM